MKYIFVTGGVVSGLGKGIATASLGKLLKARGLNAALGKFDPYLNVDPGNMNPYQHGEIFITHDGGETDLDVGHYERFNDINLDKLANTSAGKIYYSVLTRERQGGFQGGTVQVIPHITNAIMKRIRKMGKPGIDVVIAEIGGTVGDIESQPFLEAARQMASEEGRENVMYIHLSLMVSVNGELKSKPTQHSAKELLEMGIQPDVIICRTEFELNQEIRDKIGLFCNIKKDCVIQNKTAESVYEVPLLLQKEGLDDVVCRRLSLNAKERADMSDWEEMVSRFKSCDKKARVAIVGKYTETPDAYLSLSEALRHAGADVGYKIEIDWVPAESVNDDNAEVLLRGALGIIVPSGFGSRGVEGKIAAARYARENSVPFLGIGLGMQLAVLEFARNVCSMEEARSSEFDENAHPIIENMQNLSSIPDDSMRRGNYPCVLKQGSKAFELYGAETIEERHRHRHEISERFLEPLAAGGLLFSGMSPDGKLAEIVEIPSHPFYIGVQFHPEFTSRPYRPHPLISGFVKAGIR